MTSLRVESVVRSDVIVVGSGIAGLTAALGCGPLSVHLLTKGSFGRASSSWLAQGGIAVAWAVDDSPGLHAADTLAVGGGLSNPLVADIITREGPAVIRQLIQLGARFDVDESGQLRLGREAAHSRRRVVHANGDATGAAVVEALTRAVRESRSVQCSEHCQALDLLVEGGRVQGVLGLTREGKLTAFLGGATVLATGGIGSVFGWTTNPPESTGDGLAMAARAGATLADIEFMQFHPTALQVKSSPLPLLTEALRGEGSVLLDSGGHRFMVDDHPSAELAPRDVVSRSIWKRQVQGMKVYLDARDAVGEAFPRRFPTVFRLCREHGLDPRHELIPVTPAAHYHIGGILVDETGRTSLEGLWACGETAASLVHGANRLASNSLLEALVFGHRVASAVRADWRPKRYAADRLEATILPCDFGSHTGARQHLRAVMWEKVGLIRDRKGLEAALEEIQQMESGPPVGLGEFLNMLTVGRLLAASALARTESRGVHFRLDYPKSRKEWARHQILTNPSSQSHEVRLAQAN